MLINNIKESPEKFGRVSTYDNGSATSTWEFLQTVQKYESLLCKFTICKNGSLRNQTQRNTTE